MAARKRAPIECPNVYGLQARDFRTCGTGGAYESGDWGLGAIAKRDSISGVSTMKCPQQPATSSPAEIEAFLAPKGLGLVVAKDENPRPSLKSLDAEHRRPASRFRNCKSWIEANLPQLLAAFPVTHPLGGPQIL
jgi:hypothetical protein